MTNYELRITNKAGHTITNGFTLVELIVVIFIISLTASIVMPSLWRSEEASLKSEAKHIGNTLRYIYDEAVSKKQDYALKFDIENNSWAFEGKGESRSFVLEDDVLFRDVVVPSHGEVSAGELILVFGPLGPEEPITLHLMKGKYEYTVTFNHLNGRARVLEGYIS